jgi:hypothetical protein
MANRRTFLKATGAGAIALCVDPSGSAAIDSKMSPIPAVPDELPIISASYGPITTCMKSFGDCWLTTWADDGYLYSVSDDTTGFDGACKSNLAVNRITCDSPPVLEGITINPMTEYGRSGERDHRDDANWKGAGITCVDGVLYLSVCRNRSAYTTDPRGPDYWVQESWDASIIKSVDHGKTWSAMPEINRAMFPGFNFCQPSFVDYGKNNEWSKDEFIYAVSPNGSWNNSPSMTIGRVRRDRIARLDPTDWEFFGSNKDREFKAVWQPRVDIARPVLRAPSGLAGVYYFPGLDLYILPQWSRDYSMRGPQEWRLAKQATRIDLYQARAPWGPWTLFHRQMFDPQGFYSPVIPSNLISKDGARFWMFVSGNPIDRKTWYRLNLIPVTLIRR